MAFRCPRCQGAQRLAIVRRLELPPDVRSDEITLQVVRCQACGFAGIAVYEESRRGAFGEEHWNHTGYHAPAADVRTVEKDLARCPRPGDADCRCAAHRRYARCDANGRWKGLEGIDLGAPFGMVR
jgi:hypothetical protein